MSGPRIHSRRFPVPPEAIDQQRHVSNVAYVGWMQELAIEHSSAVGWPMERYQEIGAGWVVRSHFIEYLRPAFAGDLIEAYTWVPEFSPRSTPRRFLFLRVEDRRPLARAETRWVFVDLATGRRRPIPPELLKAFQPVPDEEQIRRELGLAPGSG